jgi:3-(3-hydroxy-phenyl)propionate hydroxylase
MAVPVRYQVTIPLYPYARVADQDGPPRRHPIVIVGGGPVGLATALDLGLRGTPVLLLDDHEGAGTGSKAICFSKRTLDICHRLGVEGLVERGVVWNRGRVFHGDGEVFSFDLLPETGHRHPAFINLQQPIFEAYLADAIGRAQGAGAPIEMRGRNFVTGVTDQGDYLRLSVETPDGPYAIDAAYVVACDGARSPLRGMMGLGFEGRVFEDNFLIADVRMTAHFPSERWFWFKPPFEGAGQSALLHKQPDDIWRIDFQLGWDIDRAAELDEGRIRARVDAMLSSQTGEVPDYELVWTSIYTFQCRRMETFQKGRVFFAGDAAHQVSPFGARGANSGLQDAENIAWKLHAVLAGEAPEALLGTYSTERIFAADENILNSTRATDFLTPKTTASRLFRDAVLELARDHAFARPMVNSGRLSVPCIYDGFAGFGPDALDGPPATRPGAACQDARLGDGFLLDRVGGGFYILALAGDPPTDMDGLTTLYVPDPSPDLRTRYFGDASEAIYLIRPDQHVVARWPGFDARAIRAAHDASLGKA